MYIHISIPQSFLDPNNIDLDLISCTKHLMLYFHIMAQTKSYCIPHIKTVNVQENGTNK